MEYLRKEVTLLLCNHSGSKVTPVISAHVPLVGTSYMVHLEAMEAGKCNSWLGSCHLVTSLHPEGSMDLWWAVISATLYDLGQVI